MRIVLDSSILSRDFQLSGVGIRLLRAGLASGEHSAFVPEVVLDEVAANYERQLVDVSSAIFDALKSHRRISGKWLDNPLPTVVAFQTASEYRDQLAERIIALPAQILPYPVSEHRDLVRKATERKKPFSEKGSGYRDALIWTNVLELAAVKGQDIALITVNTKDFADKEGQLHPDLEVELSQRGLKRRSVRLFNGLEPFLEEHVKPNLKRISLESIKWQLQAGVYQEGAIEAQLGQLISEAAIGQTWAASDVGLPGEAETITIRDVEEITEVETVDVVALGDDEFAAEAETEAVVRVEFFLFKADYWAMGDKEQSTFEIWDSDWNDHYMLAEATLTVRMGLSLAIDGTGKIVAATIEWVEQSAPERLPD